MIRKYLLCASVVGFCSLLSAVSVAQMDETQTKAFPGFPGKPWTGIKTFTYTGDYLYTTTPKPYPTESYYPRSLTYNDYDYYLYTGTRNRRFAAYITYGGTPATTAGDCGHTHLNYGVKGYWSIAINGNAYHGWSWGGGGTLSGTWNDVNKTCVRSVKNSLSPNGNGLFGWGVDATYVPKTINISGFTGYFDLIVVAVMAPTHGAGDCLPKLNPATGISFKACLDPVNLYSYTY